MHFASILISLYVFTPKLLIAGEVGEIGGPVSSIPRFESLAFRNRIRDPFKTSAAGARLWSDGGVPRLNARLRRHADYDDQVTHVRDRARRQDQGSRHLPGPVPSGGNVSMGREGSENTLHEPIDVYGECLMRLMTTDGCLMRPKSLR